jgi:uncharacterized protein (TIGR00369 family)
MIETMPIENLKKLPNRGNNPCFGCGKANPYGLKMDFYTDGSAVYSHLSIPVHLCGWNELAHGGIISTVLDETMSWASMCLLRRYILTRSITVDFLKPVWTGKPIRSEGRVFEKINDREAVLEGLLYDGEGTLCARSKGRFALFTEEGIKKLGFFEDDLVESFNEVFKALG